MVQNWDITLFSPVPSLLGGMLIGSAGITLMIYSGRTMGFSGITKGLYSGGTDWKWRAAFLSSMIGASAFIRVLHPEIHETLPYELLPRIAAGGLLVGLGTGMANGCTSGHGIIGNARFSTRSLVATITFMATGILVATLTKLSDAFPVPQKPVEMRGVVEQLVPLAFALMAGFVAIYMAFNDAKNSARDSVGSMSSAVSGMVAGIGLHVSGMARPSKISAFLDVSKGMDKWDASLIFVMAGAHLMMLPFYHSVIKPMWDNGKGQSVRGKPFGLPPTNGKVDAKLVTGAAIFGSGWGLGALCPGPAHVGLASFTCFSDMIPIVVFQACMAMGWFLQPYVWK